jgi:hypothetical protein
LSAEFELRIIADALIVELVPKDYLFPRSLSKLENHNLRHFGEPYTRRN